MACHRSTGDRLRAPVTGELRRCVRALLRRGQRRIVVDLSDVSRLDAAGVGELVRAYNMTAAAHGALRVVAPSERVRVMLARAGLLELLAPAAAGSTSAPLARR